jgi:hypothetical protein
MKFPFKSPEQATPGSADISQKPDIQEKSADVRTQDAPTLPSPEAPEKDISKADTIKEIKDDNGEVIGKDGALEPNKTFTLNGVEYKTDDNGTFYCINGKYLPGKTYLLNGIEYKTDDKGRIYCVSAKLLPNISYQLDKVDYKTDDNSVIFCVAGQLQPNCTYQLNRNIYKTDKNGNIVNCLAKPKLNPEKRDTVAQKMAGGTDRKAGDQGGHIVACSFGGDSGIGNLVAMDSRINQGDYNKDMECYIKNALEAGKDITTETTLIYAENSSRPSIIKVAVFEDERLSVEFFFDNDLGKTLLNEIPGQGKEDVAAELAEKEGVISSVKKEYDDKGTLKSITVSIRFGEDLKQKVKVVVDEF